MSEHDSDHEEQMMTPSEEHKPFGETATTPTTDVRPVLSQEVSVSITPTPPNSPDQAPLTLSLEKKPEEPEEAKAKGKKKKSKKGQSQKKPVENVEPEKPVVSEEVPKVVESQKEDHHHHHHQQQEQQETATAVVVVPTLETANVATNVVEVVAPVSPVGATLTVETPKEEEEVKEEPPAAAVTAPQTCSAPEPVIESLVEVKHEAAQLQCEPPPHVDVDDKMPLTAEKEAEEKETQQLPSSEKESKPAAEKKKKDGKRHLEQRPLRRFVWSTAGSAIAVGSLLTKLGVKNGHQKVLRRVMRLMGGFKKMQMPGVVQTKETIAGVPCRIYRPVPVEVKQDKKKKNSPPKQQQQQEETPPKPEEENKTKTKLPVVVYLHGGGWVVGSARGYHPFTLKLCRDVGAIVVSVDYRLAPEHPYPIPLEDCLAVTRCILNADQSPDDVGSLAGEINTNRVLLAGDSAGGNLTGAVALDLIRNGDKRLRGCLMACPVTQMITSMHDSALKYRSRYSRSGLGWFAAQYAGVPPSQPLINAFNSDQHLSPEQRLPWLKYVMPKCESAAAADVIQAEVTDEKEQLLSGKSENQQKTANVAVVPEAVVQLATTARAWPLLANDELLAQLPTVMVQSCSHDLLLTENLVFVDRLRHCGAPDVQHSHMERSEHCEAINADLIRSKAGRQGYLEIVEFLRATAFDDAKKTVL